MRYPDQPVTIGEMRQRVVFATVTDAIVAPGTSGRSYTYTQPEFAVITPTGTQMFYENYNTEMETTHIIYTRYRSDAGAYRLIVQHVILPDTGETEEIQYEVMRSTDWNGVRIFSRFDVRVLSRVT